jgi:hypothetical protein
MSHQKTESDLPWSGVMGGCDFLQELAAGGARLWKISMTEWAVGNHGNIVLFTPRDYGVLDRTLLKVIENLIANRPAGASQVPDFLKVRHIEVANAPRKDLSLLF